MGLLLLCKLMTGQQDREWMILLQLAMKVEEKMYWRASSNSFILFSPSLFELIPLFHSHSFCPSSPSSHPFPSFNVSNFSIFTLVPISCFQSSGIFVSPFMDIFTFTLFLSSSLHQEYNASLLATEKVCVAKEFLSLSLTLWCVSHETLRMMENVCKDQMKEKRKEMRNSEKGKEERRKTDRRLIRG